MRAYSGGDSGAVNTAVRQRPAVLLWNKGKAHRRLTAGSSGQNRAALQQLENGNTAAAINQLQAFINQVNAFINAGTLSQTEAQPLIDAAQAIIDLLSA